MKLFLLASPAVWGHVVTTPEIVPAVVSMTVRESKFCFLDMWQLAVSVRLWAVWVLELLNIHYRNSVYEI